jgi:hypothetical protein
MAKAESGQGLHGATTVMRQFAPGPLWFKTYRSGDFELTSDEPPIAAELVQTRERGMCANSGHLATRD